jgi:hypothetical protein
MIALHEQPEEKLRSAQIDKSFSRELVGIQYLFISDPDDSRNGPRTWEETSMMIRSVLQLAALTFF